MKEVERGTGLSRGFLATEIANTREKKIARTVVGVSLIAFAAVVPFVRVPLPRIPAFVPAYEAALWVTETITGILLLGQFCWLRSRALLTLATGYLFDGLMVIPHALSFPGVVSETGLMGAGPQTTAWIYIFWHSGFPLCVLAYALMARRRSEVLVRNPGMEIATAVLGAVALVIVLTLVATVGHDLLPVVMKGNDYSLTIRKGFTPALWAMTAATLLVLWRRSIPTVLELWLTVVMVAWLLDIALSGVLGSHRFDLGWYAGRLYGLIAASFILGVFLIEMYRLYGNLTEALALAERRNAELVRSREEFALVQRFEAIGQLVAGVAHDFNNTLTGITGAIDLVLRDTGLTQRNRRLLEASMQAARRGAQTTHQLLTFARRKILRPDVVNLNEVIARLDGFIAGAAGENVRITTKLSPMLWPARVDRTQFETALVNLVVNARDAMDGRGDIIMETRNTVVAVGEVVELAAGDYVLITVTDSGCGMAPDIVERAFDPFFTTKEVGKGSGLGLSQVYGFSRGAAGQVRIKSTLGEGTTIEIFLPKSTAQPIQAQPFGLPPVCPATAHEMILVVEDDPLVRDIVVTGLTDLGYQVKIASDAQQALEILRTDPNIDVLFSDVVMPGRMSGAKLAVEAQAIRPALKVVLTSGYAATELAGEHELPQALEVLAKPYGRDELASKLRVVIGDRAS
jgi:signal transduction histidine kinase/ActR/RegA family two-component response regulator